MSKHKRPNIIVLSAFAANRCPHCKIVVPAIAGVVAVHSDYRALFSGGTPKKCVGSLTAVRK